MACKNASTRYVSSPHAQQRVGEYSFLSSAELEERLRTGAFEWLPAEDKRRRHALLYCPGGNTFIVAVVSTGRTAHVVTVLHLGAYLRQRPAIAAEVYGRVQVRTAQALGLLGSEASASAPTPAEVHSPVPTESIEPPWAVHWVLRACGTGSPDDSTDLLLARHSVQELRALGIRLDPQMMLPSARSVHNRVAHAGGALAQALDEMLRTCRPDKLESARLLLSETWPVPELVPQSTVSSVCDVTEQVYALLARVWQQEPVPTEAAEAAQVTEAPLTGAKAGSVSFTEARAMGLLR